MNIIFGFICTAFMLSADGNQLILKTEFGNRSPQRMIKFDHVPSSIKLQEFVRLGKMDGSGFSNLFIGIDGAGRQYFTFKIYGINERMSVHFGGCNGEEGACLIVHSDLNKSKTAIPLNKDYVLHFVKLVFNNDRRIPVWQKENFYSVMEDLPEYHRIVIFDVMLNIRHDKTITIK